MKYRDNAYTVCYDSLSVFKSKENAKKFYSECYQMSEGAEHERYASILVDLNFSNVGKDNVSSDCRDIRIEMDEDEFLITELDENLSIDEAIKYYEEKIQPILDVSDDYGVDFNRIVPFDDFGSDEEMDYMASFSKYYKELFEKFNIEFDNIYTEEISDGKYNLIVNDLELRLRASDKIESVIDNVETMIEISKNKNIEEKSLQKDEGVEI